MAHDTIPSRLLGRARTQGDDPAYYVKLDERWQGTSWREHAREVERAAKALIALGLEPGQTVALVGFNRPEWTTLMLAAQVVGGRAAGLYPATPISELLALLEHAEARFVLVDRAALRDTLSAARPRLPQLVRIVSLDEAHESEGAVLDWESFLAEGREVSDESLEARREAVKPDDVAVLVYTSSGEGEPRGAMLSHRNLLWSADTVRDLLRLQRSDSSLSYLPLSHISEQLLTVHGPLSTGHTVYYAEELRKAPENLRDVQPTIAFSVPRIWEKLQQGIQARLDQVHGPRAGVVEWARDVARRVVESRCEGKDPPLELALQYELAEKLVLGTIKRALGLGGARVCLSGAAPISEQTLRFFASIGLQVLEVYGLSESSGLIAMNQPRRTRLGTAGPRLPGTRISIAPDGEVLVSGPHVFVGYHRDPQASAAALSDGRLHTGDLGRLDAEGFLTITGTKREIIVTGAGRHVAPRRIETALRDEELVRDAIVIGHGRPYLVALLTVDEEVARRLGLGGPPHENEIVRERVAQHVSAVNAALPAIERIERYTLLPRALTSEAGELTQTMKVRRERIEALWTAEIEGLYAEPRRSVAPIPSA